MAQLMLSPTRAAVGQVNLVQLQVIVCARLPGDPRIIGAVPLLGKSRRCATSPRLTPRWRALLDLGKDRVSNFLIDVELSLSHLWPPVSGSAVRAPCPSAFGQRLANLIWLKRMFRAEQRGEGAARPATANGSVKGVRRGWCGPQPEARTRAPTQPTRNARRSPLERDGRGCWADREKDDVRYARFMRPEPGRSVRHGRTHQCCQEALSSVFRDTLWMTRRKICFAYFLNKTKTYGV